MVTRVKLVGAGDSSVAAIGAASVEGARRLKREQAKVNIIANGSTKRIIFDFFLFFIKIIIRAFSQSRRANRTLVRDPERPRDEQGQDQHVERVPDERADAAQAQNYQQVFDNLKEAIEWLDSV